MTAINSCTRALWSVAFLTLSAAPLLATADPTLDADGAHCMRVDLGLILLEMDGSCAVRDYWAGTLQEEFYPFTLEGHLFNCEVSGEFTKFPIKDDTGTIIDFALLPSSVKNAEGTVVAGTIGDYPFEGSLQCATLTNEVVTGDATTNLAQPFLLAPPKFYPRLTDVSILDGAITVGGAREIDVVLVTRGAGLLHVEELTEESLEVGATLTHSALGLVVYKQNKHGKIVSDVLEESSADLLLQGHVFHEEPPRAMLRGWICSESLQDLLDGKGRKNDD